MARGLGKVIVKDSDAKQNPGSSHVKKEDPSPSPVNLGDQAGLKRGLDDCAVSVRSSCIVMYFLWRVCQSGGLFPITTWLDPDLQTL